MKKALICFAFFFALGMAAANAQSCGASASAGKACCAGKIAKAAAADPSIEKQTAQDGTVAYVRKEADAQGNVRLVSVKFDEVAGAFVNVAPKMMSADAKEGMTKKEASCSMAEKKACCAAGGEKKACCAAGGEKKACAGKMASSNNPQ